MMFLSILGKTGIWKKDELYHGAKKSIVFSPSFITKDFYLTFKNEIEKIKSNGESETIFTSDGLNAPITVDRVQNVILGRIKKRKFKNL